jgi:hypothetical protein
MKANTEQKELMVMLPIAYQTMEDLFVTALEGGSDYWCQFSDESYDAVRDAVPNGSFSEATWKAISEFDVKIRIYDAESGDMLGLLTRELITQRMVSMHEDKGVLSCMINILNEDFDATDADVVFQYLLMGEIVFG